MKMTPQFEIKHEQTGILEVSDIRGWLTNFNDPPNLYSDLFGMEIFYNNINPVSDPRLYN